MSRDRVSASWHFREKPVYRQLDQIFHDQIFQNETSGPLGEADEGRRNIDGDGGRVGFPNWRLGYRGGSVLDRRHAKGIR
jgi:hypothetical protein